MKAVEAGSHPGSQSSARLILVSGLPGAGKTTLARQLAQEIPAIRICPDELLAIMGVELDNAQARAQLERQLLPLAFGFIALNHTVVLELPLWLRAERDQVLSEVRARDITAMLYFLDVPLAELQERIKNRNTNAGGGTGYIDEQQLAEWAGMVEIPDEIERHRFSVPSL